jgi:acyl-CoA thioester hydrolase
MPDIPAPLTRTGRVDPAWIDYNGHVTDACYGLAFDGSTMALLDLLGVGPAYLRRTGHTVFTVECHLRFLRQVHVQDELRFTSLLLGYDAKRLHAHHTLTAGDGDEPAATCELLFLHVEHAPGRVVPFPERVLARLDEVLRAHAALPRPEALGGGVRLGPRAEAPAP